MPSERLLRSKEVCQRLGISYPTLARWVREGRIKAVRTAGGKYRIPESEVTRTVIVRSALLPRRAFRAFVELEGMYMNVVEQLVLYAMSNGITKFTRLKAEKYREVRSLYPRLPSH